MTDAIRTPYASGESRDFIPYSVLGSGGLLIENILISFQLSPYIPYQNSSNFG